MSSDTPGMTLEARVGQLFMVGFQGLVPSPEIIELIQRNKIGGIILFGRNIRSTQQVLELTNALQKIAKEADHPYPLLIATDQENGRVQRLSHGATPFPGNMALGAVGSEQLAYNVALAVGRELKAVGINMNLAPAIDVNNNPANPVIGIRSFSEDPREVARLGAAFVKGYNDAGVISTLKHFPGHGDTAIDSHLALPTIPYEMARLAQVELLPFKKCIEAGAPAVMIAHIHFPSLEREPLPATVSPAIIQGLLRDQLGFEKLVISDCMEMKAVSETIGVEQASLLALQAGMDLVLISHLYTRQQGGIETILTAARNGTLSIETVDRACERVRRIKQSFLSWDNLPPSSLPQWVGGEAHHRLSEQAYNLSTTLVRDNDALLPLRLKANEHILVVIQPLKTITQAESRQYLGPYFVERIRQRHVATDSIAVSEAPTDNEYNQILQAMKNACVTITVTVNASMVPRQAEFVQRLVVSGQPMIGIAAGTPYDLQTFPQLGTCLATYEYTRPALEAAVRVIFGEVEPQGCLPVSIPGLYERGHSATLIP